MTSRAVTITLSKGDVSGFRVARGKGGTRVLVYQRGEQAALVEAILDAGEAEQLGRRLLQNGPRSSRKKP